MTMQLFIALAVLMAMTAMTVSSFTTSLQNGRSPTIHHREIVIGETTTTTTTTTTRLRYESSNNSRAVSRESLVQPVRTVKEYEALVLDEKDKLVIVRFHAPWCRVCRATNMSYERGAAKIQGAHPQKVKFLSVNMDGSEGSNELKDSLSKDHGLDVPGVPMGMLYHPGVERGVFGKVKLNRRQLKRLKQNVEVYLREGGGEVDLVSLLDDLEMA